MLGNSRTLSAGVLLAVPLFVRPNSGRTTFFGAGMPRDIISFPLFPEMGFERTRSRFNISGCPLRAEPCNPSESKLLSHERINNGRVQCQERMIAR